MKKFLAALLSAVFSLDAHGFVGGAFDLGYATINAPGAFQFSLKALPQNCVVYWLDMYIDLTAVASEASYSMVVDNIVMAGESLATSGSTVGDDVDRILSAVLTSIDFIVGTAFSCVSAIPIPVLRTALAYMTGQDFTTPANGTAIVNSAGTDLDFNIRIPLGLDGIMPDLSIMNQGALRFNSAGVLNLKYGPLSSAKFSGTFVDNSHTFTITPASVSIRLSANCEQAATGPGTVGALWRINFGSGFVTSGATQPGIHLGLFDQSSQIENTGSDYVSTAYNVSNGGNQIASNTSPNQLINNFKGARSLSYAVDSTARGVPMQFYKVKDNLTNIDQSGNAIQYQVTETGAGTLNLLEILAIPPGEGELTDVASRVNGGGPVAVGLGVAKSMMGKLPSSPAVMPLLPVILYPESTAPAGLPVYSPAQVGTAVAAMKAAQSQAAKAAAPAGKTGHALVGKR